MGGLTEYYKESICILATRLTGKLPVWCDCRSLAWGTANTSYVKTTPAHNMRNETQETWSVVDSLTREDLQLYSSVKQQFLRALRQVEHDYNVTLLCSTSKQRSGGN